MEPCNSPFHRARRRLLVVMALCFLFGGCSSADGGVSDLEFVDPPIDPPIIELISDVEASNPPVTDTSAPADVTGPEDSVGPPSSDVVTPPDDADAVPSDDVVSSDAASPLDDVTADTSESGTDVSEDVSPAISDVDLEDVSPDVEGDTSGPQDAAEEDVALDVEDPTADTMMADGVDAADEDTVEVPPCSSDDECTTPEQPCRISTCQDGACVELDAPLGTPCVAEDAGGDVSCVQSSCDASGACVSTVLEGGVCDDGNPCTTGESCDATGSCAGGSQTLCPSTGPCEIGLCDVIQGCVPLAVADGLLCDDGDPCTVQTACASGVCGGGENLCTCLEDSDCYEDGDFCNGVPSCVDLEGGGKGCQIASETVVNCAQPEDPCFIGVCDPSDGSCSDAVLAGGSCDDGDACTQGDACDDIGGCSGVALVCDDGVPCTGDQCEDGLCVFTSLDGALCNDDDPCTIKDVCLSAACAGKLKSCDDGNPCTLDECDAESGTCVHTFDDGADCDDGSACTEGDLCNQGACLGTVVNCDDDNVCTDEACAPETGCIITPNTAGCPDGDMCTGPDLCDQGECVTAPLKCDDSVACTVDACEPGKGCVNLPDAEACDDGNPCTTDKCLAGQGCIFVPNTLACDDESLCTFGDVCSGGVCGGQPILCSDGVDCTVDSCDLETGLCLSVGDDLFCDDGNPCTVTGCDQESGCVKVDDDGAECDDDVPCTEGDLCSAGVCTPGANICPCAIDADCDDEDLCNGVYACEETTDGLTECLAVVEPVVCKSDLDTACLINQCDALSGVCDLVSVEDGAPCVDSDACTTEESCVEGGCVVAEVTCDDGVACTLDGCEPSVGCVHTPSQSACDDTVACTVDACLALTGCIHEPDSAACSDEIPCTVDVCNAEDGCQHVEDSGPCDDGVACTLDVCDLETGCFSVVDDAQCEDGNECTAEVCTDTGCVVEVVEGDCEDGNLCTAGDLCVAGECQSGAPVDCDDGDLCTKDVCSLLDGTCLEGQQPDGWDCEDGSLCTELDTCVEGACVAGPVATCDDALACTIDACDPATGCAYTADDEACDDGNACTIDVCIPGQGCEHHAVSDFTSCDDGVSGTAPDVCLSGLCRGGQNASIGVPTLWCQIESASLEKVSAFDGSVYGLMTYKLSGILCDTVPCTEGGGYCHSRVLRLDGVSTSAVATLGGVLTGLSYDGVVGQSGQVGQIAAGGFTVFWNWSDLASAITSGGMAGGTWTDIWGAPLPDDNGTAYTLVGRTSAAGDGRVVQCRLDDTGASCDPVSLDFDEWSWDDLTPTAVSGTVDDGLPLAAVAVQGLSPGAPSGLWLTEDSEEFAFSLLGPDLTVQGVMRPSVDTAWLFGADGLIASIDGAGWSTWPSELEGLSLYAATTVGETLVAVGDHPETEEAWLVALDLDAEPEDPASWHLVSLGSGRQARDVYASADGLTIVGAELQPDSTTRPYLWHLKL